jgi:hypothetical protein
LSIVFFKQLRQLNEWKNPEFESKNNNESPKKILNKEVKIEEKRMIAE